jgi:hypothetical protein
MGSPDVYTTPQIIQTETPVSDLILDPLVSMSEPNKTDTMHTERVDEVEGQEVRPKIALSTILAVFVRLQNERAV